MHSDFPAQATNRNVTTTTAKTAPTNQNQHTAVDSDNNDGQDFLNKPEMHILPERTRSCTPKTKAYHTTEPLKNNKTAPILKLVTSKNDP